MKAPAFRPGRFKPKRSGPLTVPEHTNRPAKIPQPADGKPQTETPEEEAIRKMLEAAYT